MQTVRQTAGPVGISGKLRDTIHSMIDLSQELQDAILKRNVEHVWDILAKQENYVSEMEQYSFLWNHLINEADPTDNSMNQLKEDLKSDVCTLKLLGRRNMSLAKAFLTAIRKAIKVTGTQIAGNKKTFVYGKHGRMKTKQSSLLVNKIG